MARNAARTAWRATRANALLAALRAASGTDMPVGIRSRSTAGRGPADAPSVISATPGPASAVGLGLQPVRIDDFETARADAHEAAPLEVGEQLVDGHACRADRRREIFLGDRHVGLDPPQLEQVLREPSGVVEEHELHESAEHDERIASRIATVIDDLAGPEAAQVHLARERVALRLGEDLDRQHVAERAGHRTKLVQIHRY